MLSKPNENSKNSTALIDISAILLVASVIAGVSLYYANEWFLSCIGDEWIVYGRASKVAQANGVPLVQFFGPLRSGEYNVHAPILTAIQGVFLKIFGVSNFGWRTSGVILSALSCIPFYIIARALLSRSGAIVASLLMVSAYYLIIESMWGYGWTQMRFFALVTIASLVLFAQRPSILRCITLGVCAGCCTLLTGLVAYIAPLSLAIALLYWWKRRTPGVVGWFTPVLLFASWWGFCKLPGRLLGEYESFVEQMRATMWKTSLGPFLGSVFGPTWERNREAYAPSPDRVWSYIADMMGQAVVAPIAEVHPSHFVYGKMIDPVFGYTALLGLAVSLVLAFRKTEWRIFWIYFLPAMFFTAGLSPYGILPNTRLHFLVPFWALASALVVQYILHRIPKFLGILAIAAWIGGASFWSLQKSFREVPKQFWLTDTTYAIELAQKLPDFRIIFVGKEWQLAGSLLKPYGLSERAEWRMEMAPEEEATLSSDPKTVVVRFSALQRRMWSPEIVQKTGFVGIRPVQ